MTKRRKSQIEMANGKRKAGTTTRRARWFWVIIVVGLMVSYVISFYFSANTIIYALMRKRVDKTALDEVYTGADEMAADSMLATPQPEAETGPADTQQLDEDPETSE